MPLRKDGKAKNPSHKGERIRRNPLQSQAGIVAEMSRLYRLARRGKLKPDEARSHIWCLEKIGQRLDAIMLERIELRLREMSVPGDGLGRVYYQDAEEGEVVNGSDTEEPPAQLLLTN
jgi:hypothetical protein